MELKKKFREEDEKSVKVAKLKKIEQEERTMKEFVQKIAKGSRYKRRALVEKFKRKMNKVIRNKLMEAERSPTSIEQ